MSILWVGVAVGAGTLVSGAASYLGGKKQADAANKATDITQQQAQTNAATQQPFVNSGYGALGKLNTLLGINADPNTVSKNASGTNGSTGNDSTGNSLVYGATAQAPQNTPNQVMPRYQNTDPSRNQNPQLRQLLQIRADNGDAQAKQILGMMQ